MYQPIPTIGNNNNIPLLSTPTLITFGIQRRSNYVIDFQSVINNPNVLEKINYNPPQHESHTVFQTATAPQGISYQDWGTKVIYRLNTLCISENKKRDHVLDLILQDPHMSAFTRMNHKMAKDGMRAMFSSSPSVTTTTPQLRINRNDPNSQKLWLQERFATIPDCDSSAITNEIHAHLMQLTDELNQIYPFYIFNYLYYPTIQDRIHGNLMEIDRFQITVSQRMDYISTTHEIPITVVGMPQPVIYTNPQPGQPGVELVHYPDQSYPQPVNNTGNPPSMVYYAPAVATPVTNPPPPPPPPRKNQYSCCGCWIDCCWCLDCGICCLACCCM